MLDIIFNLQYYSEKNQSFGNYIIFSHNFSTITNLNYKTCFLSCFSEFNVVLKLLIEKTTIWKSLRLKYNVKRLYFFVVHFLK